MISQTAEYALRAMTCLGNNPDKPLTNQQIADMAMIPFGYLAKVMQALGRGGLVKSFRGLHGGFVLSKPPAQTTILEVIQAVESIPRIKLCPLGRPEHRSGLCPLHRRLDEAMAVVERSFSQTTLAEVLGDASSQGTGGLCPIGSEGARP